MNAWLLSVPFFDYDLHMKTFYILIYAKHVLTWHVLKRLYRQNDSKKGHMKCHQNEFQFKIIILLREHCSVKQSEAIRTLSWILDIKAIWVQIGVIALMSSSKSHLSAHSAPLWCHGWTQSLYWPNSGRIWEEGVSARAAHQSTITPR